jgi:hypothetical protein
VVTLRRGRLRIVLVGFVIVMLGSFSLLFLSLTSAPVGIDRNDPGVVVRLFLQAAAVDRDPARAQPFLCDQWPANQAIQQLTVTTDPSVITTWGVLQTNTTGDTAEAVVRITWTVGDFSEVEVWHFDLRRTDAWRICSGFHEPLTPAPTSSASLTPK